jgi:hypothetical protein
MTHDELLAKLKPTDTPFPQYSPNSVVNALVAVVELHNQDFGTPGEYVVCDYCKVIYPCPTIKIIEEKLG